MPTWAKVLLIVTVSVIGLVGVLIGVGAYVAYKYGPALQETGKKAMVEGYQFARGVDNQACLDEGVARHQRADGLGALIKNGLFLHACLEKSRETPGFCDAVPGQGEVMKSIEWRMQQCQAHALTDSQCGQLFTQVQEYC